MLDIKYIKENPEEVIERLRIKGKDAKEVAGILRGNTCGMKGTSCADQFAKAIDENAI